MGQMTRVGRGAEREVRDEKEVLEKPGRRDKRKREARNKQGEGDCVFLVMNWEGEWVWERRLV